MGIAPERNTDTYGEKNGQISAVPLELELAGGYQLQLVLRAEAQTAGVYPFVTLGTNGRYARVHLARIVNADGVPLRYVALKVQRDRYDVETDRGNLLTNRDIAQLWEREYQNLRSLREAGDVMSVELLSSGGSLPVLPPLVYCRHRQRFFHPPCPACGQELRDCEDNSLLTRRELSRHSQSNIRYLYCQSCHRQSADAPFYRFQAGERERRAGVRDFKNLCDDWRSLAGADGKTGGKEPRSPFPCRGCPSYQECYGGVPKGPAKAEGGPGALAAQRLVPFSLFDYRALPLEVLRLHYDEFADCLGGIDWQSFLSEHRGNREGIPERIFLTDFRTQLSRADRFLFADSGGLEAVEVFRLKLVLFTQLCRRVRDFHAQFRGPHLDLKPENAMVEIPPLSKELPFLWNFRVKLIDLAATIDFHYGDEGSPHALPAPPINYSEIYTSPIIRHGQFGHQRQCDIQFCELAELGDGRYRITARLHSPDLIAEEYTDKDVFRISINQVEAGEPLFIWASKVSAADLPPGAMEVVGEPMGLKPGTLASLQYLGTQLLHNVSFETYHSFGVPCDVYSLGVILLRTLLSGKRQNLAVVSTKLLQPILHELQSLRDSGAAEPAQLSRKVRHFLAQNACTRREMVYWDGDPARPNEIPLDLWYDTLATAVRMCTNFPGFSYSSGRGDFDREEPQRTMDLILAELEKLGARAHSALFSREELNREVREALANVRARIDDRESDTGGK